MNDSWPGASWSSVDYYKRKKGLHYYTRKFFADVLPIVKLENGKISVDSAYDGMTEAHGLLRVTAYHMDGRRLGEQTRDVVLSANGTTTLASLWPEELGIGYSRRVGPATIPAMTIAAEKNGELMDSVVYVELTVNGVSYCNYAIFDKLVNLQVLRPDIKVLVEGRTVTIVSDRPAFAVFLEPEHDVDLSDNCMNLEPGVTYTIECSGDPGAVALFEKTQLVVDL